MKTQILTTIIFLLTSIQAFATGETMCSAATLNSKVDIYLLNSRMPASPVLSGNANVETIINNSPIKIAYDVKSYEMPGYWSVGNELKMFFYKEDYESVDFKTYTLKVEMHFDEEAMGFVGNFQIIHNDTLIDQGPIHCDLG